MKRILLAAVVFAAVAAGEDNLPAPADVLAIERLGCNCDQVSRGPNEGWWYVRVYADLKDASRWKATYAIRPLDPRDGKKASQKARSRALRDCDEWIDAIGERIRDAEEYRTKRAGK